MKEHDNPDLNITTENAELREQTAFQLGMGDAEALAGSGLIARSNAALNVLEQIKIRKDKDSKFEAAILEQLRQSLNDIGVEMDWLEDQISIEEKAIQHNNREIDFIRTLDEDNIYGADGKLRDDVSELLKKNGYDDLDGKSPDEIMHMLTIIETKLHGDNIIRIDRIDDYQDRHAHLREKARQFGENQPEGTPEDIRHNARELAERQPYEVKYRAVIDGVEPVANAAYEAELSERAQNITSTFTLG